MDGVVCATKVACHALGAGLSDSKRSVDAMKVDPHVHESELSDDKDIASNEIERPNPSANDKGDCSLSITYNYQL